MRYCTRCIYPENHPLNITFDDEGVCSGCRVHEEKDRLDWNERFQKLGEIFNDYHHRGYYDCIVPVNGGKDSYFITYIVKVVFKLNPLLVTYNIHYNTKVGIRNLANLVTKFDCDHIHYTVHPELVKKLTHLSIKKMGDMYWHCLAGMQTFPVQMAVRLKIPLIVWGVHGWSDQVGMFSHLDMVEMAKKVREEHGLRGFDAEDMTEEAMGIAAEDVERFRYPSDEEIEAVGLRGIYLGNFIRWDAQKQTELMIEKYGYESAEQERTFNPYETVDCFHDGGLHDYVKYLKYGFGKVTDHACRDIRLKRMTREEAIDWVAKYEGKKPKDMDVFLKWIGMTERELMEHIDPFRDRRIYEKDSSGRWILKDSAVNHRNDPGVEAVRLEKIEERKYFLTKPVESHSLERGYLLTGRPYLDQRNFKALED